DEAPDVVAAEGREDDLLLGRPRLADVLELAHERMRRRDLVVAVRADEEQVPQIRLDEEVFEEVDGRGVEPLQVVEEQGQRMLGPGEPAEEAPEDEVKAALRVPRRHLRDGPLIADDEPELGDEVHHELAIRTQRLADVVAPPPELRFALREDGTKEAVEG